MRARRRAHRSGVRAGRRGRRLTFGARANASTSGSAGGACARGPRRFARPAAARAAGVSRSARSRHPRTRRDRRQSRQPMDVTREEPTMSQALRATDTAEIGKTGLRVTRLGLRGVALSGAPPATDPHQPAPEDEAVALIEKSLALGVNYLDTAPMYGVGQSEERYGRALRGVPRDRYVLSTKVGRVLHPAEPGSARMAWSFDFSRTGALGSFESSLGRLGLDRVDILFIHDPDEHYDRAVAETVPVLLELRAKGRVKAIGAGMNQWQMELAFARLGHFDCFLLAGRYTLLDQTALPEFLPYCVEHGIAVVAGGPYNSGLLAVGPREGATFNYRAAAPDMMDKARRIAAVCERHRAPLKAAALQFILAHPAIASVIPGARSLAEVEENAMMVEYPIPTALWAELKQTGLIDTAAPIPAEP